MLLSFEEHFLFYIMKAMIFAAGLGTRLAPYTNSQPKAMVEIAGKPMLQMQIEKLKDFGFNYIVINVHHFSQQIIDFIKANDFGVDIYISDETEMLLDTGGGLKNAEKFFMDNDNFLLHNVDIYSNIDLRDMYNYHVKLENLVTMASMHRKSSKSLMFDDNNQLCGWKDYKTNSEIISIKKPFYNEMAFSGVYIYNYKIFKLLNKEGVFPIIPELLEISKNNKINAYIHDDKYILDLGKPEAIKECESILNS